MCSKIFGWYVVLSNNMFSHLIPTWDYKLISIFSHLEFLWIKGFYAWESNRNVTMCANIWQIDGKESNLPVELCSSFNKNLALIYVILFPFFILPSLKVHKFAVLANVCQYLSTKTFTYLVLCSTKSCPKHYNDWKYLEHNALIKKSWSRY